ncbi:MAG: AMP-binding protein [Desulfobacteraceae bacterium]|nr:AMP-binding protein [Desulfobacteraceae bacterium]
MRLRRTIRELLEHRAQHTPDFVFCIYEGREITFAMLEACVNRLANGIAELGVTSGQRVAVMLANHPEHIFTVFALTKLGAVWVPVNINFRGPSLEFIIEQSAPNVVIVDAECWNHLEPVLADKNIDIIIVHNIQNVQIKLKGMKVFDFSALNKGDRTPPSIRPTLDEIRCISFTSGTTGPPKGSLMTERMLRTCATGAAIASDVRPGDIFLLWEPIYHNSGAQMCILALMEPVKLAVVPRFSASRFWDKIREYRVTKMHYLGGVIDILLKQPPRPNDRDHSVRLAFGGGCSKDNWRAFEQRFGIEVREVYGLTEASCFTTINTSGKIGAIGKPYPYFEVQIIDDEGKPLQIGQVGEIVIRENEPGLITQGYLENPEATATALRGGWLYTGDLGRRDDEGDFYYMGRKQDSIRRRGENISAWEVERVLNSHPDIEESTVIGVDADIGEQEMKAFIKFTTDATLKPLDIIIWCEPRMPYFQIPRYVAFVDSFEKTPTQRIRKDNLPKNTDNCWDLERSGYRIKRA